MRKLLSYVLILHESRMFWLHVLYILVGAVLALSGFKVYMIWTNGRCNSFTCLAGKTAIVTGANSGIGLVTALDLAKRGARVILACRNRKLAEVARDEIIAETGNANVVVKYVDMTSMATIKAFAEDVIVSEERVDLLVNNAGAAIGFKKNEFTQDGLHVSMQTNYFGSVYLTNLLLEKLKQSAPSRIVNVSSIASRLVYIFPRDTLNEQMRGICGIENYRIYCKAKLCLILYTISLSKRLKDSGVTVSAINPGVVKTKIFAHAFGILNQIGGWFLNYCCKDVIEGAQTTIYAATAKELRHRNGGYYSDCKEEGFFWNVSEELAESVWLKTEKLLKNAEENLGKTERRST